MNIQNILFKKVQCTAFLKKVYDGKFIQVCNIDGYDCAEYADTNNPDLDLKCECDGSLKFLKTYYEPKAREFMGIVVGIKKIIVTAYLTAETNYDYTGREYLRISREPEKIIECAVVYYRNNCKRYVPLENIGGGD
jgi:hypothetical protein